ncbi:hypothetical protein D3C80_1931640 [compost metagenome]
MHQPGQLLHLHRLMKMLFDVTQHTGELAMIPGMRYIVQKIGITAPLQTDGQQLQQTGLPAQRRQEAVILK